MGSQGSKKNTLPLISDFPATHKSPPLKSDSEIPPNPPSTEPQDSQNSQNFETQNCVPGVPIPDAWPSPTSQVYNRSDTSPVLVIIDGAEYQTIPRDLTPKCETSSKVDTEIPTKLLQKAGTSRKMADKTTDQSQSELENSASPETRRVKGRRPPKPNEPVSKHWAYRRISESLEKKRLPGPTDIIALTQHHGFIPEKLQTKIDDLTSELEAAKQTLRDEKREKKMEKAKQAAKTVLSRRESDKRKAGNHSSADESEEKPSVPTQVPDVKDVPGSLPKKFGSLKRKAEATAEASQKISKSDSEQLEYFGDHESELRKSQAPNMRLYALTAKEAEIINEHRKKEALKHVKLLPVSFDTDTRSPSVYPSDNQKFGSSHNPDNYRHKSREFNSHGYGDDYGRSEFREPRSFQGREEYEGYGRHDSRSGTFGRGSGSEREIKGEAGGGYWGRGEGEDYHQPDSRVKQEFPGDMEYRRGPNPHARNVTHSPYLEMNDSRIKQEFSRGMALSRASPVPHALAGHRDSTFHQLPALSRPFTPSLSYDRPDSPARQLPPPPQPRHQHLTGFEDDAVLYPQHGNPRTRPEDIPEHRYH